mgnify:CR=1 FL=1
MSSAWNYAITATPAGPRLETGPDIGVFPVDMADGRPAGRLIGFPIDLVSGRLVEGRLRLGHALQDTPEAFVERTLRSLAGRFLWLAEFDGLSRLYPDPAASVPCVYDPHLGRAGLAALSVLSPDEAAARFDAALSRDCRLTAEGWLPAGLTAHADLHRLMPNHYLDLADFRAHRFHGAAPRPATPLAVGEAAETVLSLLRTQIGASVQFSRMVRCGNRLKC